MVGCRSPSPCPRTMSWRARVPACRSNIAGAHERGVSSRGARRSPRDCRHFLYERHVLSSAAGQPGVDLLLERFGAWKLVGIEALHIRTVLHSVIVRQTSKPRRRHGAGRRNRVLGMTRCWIACGIRFVHVSPSDNGLRVFLAQAARAAAQPSPLPRVRLRPRMKSQLRKPPVIVSRHPSQ